MKTSGGVRQQRIVKSGSSPGGALTERNDCLIFRERKVEKGGEGEGKHTGKNKKTKQNTPSRKAHSYCRLQERRMVLEGGLWAILLIFAFPAETTTFLAQSKSW